MNTRHLIAATLAALSTTAALADDPTIDTTPFVSSLSRSEVKAEVRQALKAHTLAAAGELGAERLATPVTTLTRSEVKAAVLAARSRGELQPAGEFDVATLHPSTGRTLSFTTLARAR
jgi:Cu2+-containing amine oxidase